MTQSLNTRKKIHTKISVGIYNFNVLEEKIQIFIYISTLIYNLNSIKMKLLMKNCSRNFFFFGKSMNLI